jgi:signal peptidase
VFGRGLTCHRNATDVRFVTKGDHNPIDDTSIYVQSNSGKIWLHPHNIIGRAWGYVTSPPFSTFVFSSECRYFPLVGMVTIIMNDFPWVKYVLIGSLALFALLARD